MNLSTYLKRFSAAVIAAYAVPPKGPKKAKPVAKRKKRRSR